MTFHVIGKIEDIETMAVGKAIREVRRLVKLYGKGRWKKRKGTAAVRFNDGTMATVEVPWYEAHGVGRREFKIKRFLD